MSVELFLVSFFYLKICTYVGRSYTYVGKYFKFDKPYSPFVNGLLLNCPFVYCPCTVATFLFFDSFFVI